MRVIEHQPPTYDYQSPEPIGFLGGPIQGAPDWQNNAIEIFQTIPSTIDTIHLANPRRSNAEKGDFNYAEQVSWEKRHLTKAREHGVIIFWFAAQDHTLPYEIGRAYAQTSRIELGRTLGWRDYTGVDIVMGIEDGYKGSEKYFVTCAEEHKIPLFTDLGEVCLKAVSYLEEYENDVAIGFINK
jgi:hypothetical protein